MSRRILFWGMNYAPEPIGIGKYSSELAEYLVDAGMAVEVVTAVPHYPGWSVHDGYRNRYRSGDINGVRITHCPLYLSQRMRGLVRAITPITFALTSAPVFLWRAMRQRPDVIFCVEPTLFAAPLALAVAKLAGIRTVMHVQDLEVDAAFAVGHLKGGVLRRLAEAFEGGMLRSFDTVVTISFKMRDKLRQKGVKPEKMVVIRNWVDTNDIHPMMGPSPLRAEYGIADDSFVVLYAGNVGVKQGLGLIPDIAETLKAHRDITFVIAGEGPEKNDLQARCREMDNVRFLPLQPKERLCALLSMADLHLLPQMKDIADLVLPSKLGGMLASGRACAVMADPGTELFEFLNGSAVLIPSGDVDQCASAILRVKRKDVTYSAEGNAGLLKMLDAKSILPFFASVIESGREKCGS